MIKQNKEVAQTPFVPEDKIAELLQKNCSMITVQAILDTAGKIENDEERQELADRISRELSYCSDLVPVEPGPSYRPAAALFNGAEFLIVPDGFEIDNNILIPGHRFVPFMHEELFPSEITFKEAGARKKQSSVEFTDQAENIIKYHLLLGAETLFDFFAAEAEENIESAKSSTNPKLKLSVLDMKKFYAETDFAEGDALLVKVVDYATGLFEFTLSTGKERSSKKMDAYRKKLEETLAAVTGEFMPGAPIVEQLKCLFANQSELLKNPAMSLDEILIKDSAFDIAFDEDGSSLTLRSEDDDLCDCGEHHHHGEECSCGHDHSHDHRLPDNVTIGSGETGSLASMLAKLYPMLTLVELDAILLDNLKNHDLDFNSFYARAFGETALPFADGLQEACFFNELEQRFEEMLDNYPREFDGQTGEIRSMIVEFTMERCTLLTELAELSSELNIKSELFEHLAEVALLLEESLKLVNAPAAIGEDFDFDSLREGVENALETGSEVFNALREVLDGND